MRLIETDDFGGWSRGFRGKLLQRKSLIVEKIVQNCNK